MQSSSSTLKPATTIFLIALLASIFIFLILIFSSAFKRIQDLRQNHRIETVHAELRTFVDSITPSVEIFLSEGKNERISELLPSKIGLIDHIENIAIIRSDGNIPFSNFSNNYLPSQTVSWVFPYKLDRAISTRPFSINSYFKKPDLVAVGPLKYNRDSKHYVGWIIVSGSAESSNQTPSFLETLLETRNINQIKKLAVISLILMISICVYGFLQIFEGVSKK